MGNVKTPGPPERVARASAVGAYASLWIGFAVALAVASWDLRGFSTYEMIDMDSPRHALNGAFFYDCFRLGHVADPVTFINQYFSHLPALSLPYHPPLFPLFEAAIYAVFGVSGSSARIAIAVCVAISIFIMYRLVLATHRYMAQAVCAVALFAFIPLSQYLGSEVMLEFPAMVCVLGSVYCFVRSGPTLIPKLIVASALFAGAGCWTKQTIFIGLVPLTTLFLEGRTRSIFTKRLGLWYLIFGGTVILYVGMLISVRWNGMGAFWAYRNPWAQFLFNVRFYSHVSPLTLICILITGAGSVVILARPSLFRTSFVTRNAVYLALIISCVLVAIVAPAYDARYMFFAFPSLVVMFLDATFMILRRKLSSRSAACGIAAASAIYLFVTSRPADYLGGPRDAAKLLVRAGAKRILYQGVANGHFIFDIRTLDPTLQTTVIRGDKLPSNVFEPTHLTEFARAYGVDYVVYQTTPTSRLPPIPFELIANLPVTSSEPYQNGSLAVYRTGVTNRDPKHQLSITINSLGRKLDLIF